MRSAASTGPSDRFNVRPSNDSPRLHGRDVRAADVQSALSTLRRRPSRADVQPLCSGFCPSTSTLELTRSATLRSLRRPGGCRTNDRPDGAADIHKVTIAVSGRRLIEMSAALARRLTQRDLPLDSSNSWPAGSRSCIFDRTNHDRPHPSVGCTRSSAGSMMRGSLTGCGLASSCCPLVCTSEGKTTGADELR
jgi:hypothetical protein